MPMPKKKTEILSENKNKLEKKSPKKNNIIIIKNNINKVKRPKRDISEKVIDFNSFKNGSVTHSIDKSKSKNKNKRYNSVKTKKKSESKKKENNSSSK